MAKQIYYLQSCDEWKSKDSMRLIFIGTSQRKLMMQISKEIEEENMIYKPCSLETEFVDGEFVQIEKLNSPKKQAKLFRQDWKTETRSYINSLLEYGYFDYTYDNEEM